jgi:hypothetical protein
MPRSAHCPLVPCVFRHRQVRLTLKSSGRPSRSETAVLRAAGAYLRRLLPYGLARFRDARPTPRATGKGCAIDLGVARASLLDRGRPPLEVRIPRPELRTSQGSACLGVRAVVPVLTPGGEMVRSLLMSAIWWREGHSAVRWACRQNPRCCGSRTGLHRSLVMSQRIVESWLSHYGKTSRRHSHHECESRREPKASRTGQPEPMAQHPARHRRTFELDAELGERTFAGPAR